MARQTRPWTPAEMAHGPTIWVDGNAQTNVLPNGVVFEVIANAGGPTTYGGASAQYRAVLQADAGGRKWLCAPLWTADFSPDGITPAGTARMVPNASFPGVSDALTAQAIEALCVTRRAADSTQTGVMVVLQAGSTSEMSLGFRRQPASITAYGYAAGATKTAVGTSGVSTAATLARGFIDYTAGKLAMVIGGGTPVETSFTAPTSGHFEPASAATWAAPQVGQQNYDTAEALIFFRRLTVDEAAQLEGYLAHKWGIADSLPDSHPYKSAPPMVDVPEPETVPEVSEAVRYRDWLPKQAPGWLQKPNGRAWLWAHGDVLDSVDDLAHKAVLARFPDYTTEDGLSLIGGERGIARGADETASDYADRLKDAWTLWQSSGTPAAVLSALRGLGVTNAEIRSEDGRTATLDASGAITYAPPRVTADADERPVRWVTCPDLWHVFQVFIPFEDGPWGEYEMPAADSPEVDALRVAIRRHCGAHAWCDGIVAVNYYGSGLANETPRLVDWPERTIEETWAQDTSEDAWFDQEPSIDNCPRCLWNVSDSGPGVTADPEVIPPAPAADLLTGLAYHYGFGEVGTASWASDGGVGGTYELSSRTSASGGASGKIDGGVAFSAGDGKAYRNDAAETVDGQLLIFGRKNTDWSAAVWLKGSDSADTNDGRRSALAFNTNSGGGYVVTIGTSDGGLPALMYGTPPTAPLVEGESDILDGSWHLLVATHDTEAEEVALYLDGALVGTSGDSSLHTGSGNVTAPFYVGRTGWSAAALCLVGDVDEVALWHGRALGQAEVQALWNGGAGLPFSDWT